jgi:hypothetical protein
MTSSSSTSEMKEKKRKQINLNTEMRGKMYLLNLTKLLEKNKDENIYSIHTCKPIPSLVVESFVNKKKCTPDLPSGFMLASFCLSAFC